MAVALQAENLTAGQSLGIETSALPSGILQLVAVEGASGSGRFLPLTGAKSDAGVPLTATATSGAMGVSRTAGTSLLLVGESAASASPKTDKAIWEFDLPDTYVAGTNIAVVVNALVTGGGTITTASTTLTLAAYTEVNGVETALTVSGAQQFNATAANYTFTITGTGLTVGAHLVLELAALVTVSAGAGVATINSVSFLA